MHLYCNDTKKQNGRQMPLFALDTLCSYRWHFYLQFLSQFRWKFFKSVNKNLSSQIDDSPTATFISTQTWRTPVNHSCGHCWVFVGIAGQFDQCDFWFENRLGIQWRTHFILIDQLRFPTGTATAEAIYALHSNDAQTKDKSTLLVRASILAGLYTLAAHFFPFLTEPHILKFIGLGVVTAWGFYLCLSIYLNLRRIVPFIQSECLIRRRFHLLLGWLVLVWLFVLRSVGFIISLIYCLIYHSTY